MKPLFWLTICFFLFVPKVKADIFLNEISAGSSPEYVELYNSALDRVELNNWYLDDVADAGSLPKRFSITLDGQSFGVVELSSMLNNSGGDSVRLLDENQHEVDSYNYTTNVSLNDIFVRCPDGGDTWILTTTSSKSQANQASCLLLTPTLLIEATPTTISMPIISALLLPTPTAHITPGVILSEVMVYPDNSEEWVELYNPNSYSVILTNWYLDDQEDGGSSPKAFSVTLNPQSFSLVVLTSAIFNNSGDQVRLLNNEKVEIDQFEYERAVKNQTFSRKMLNNKSEFCQTEPSPNQTNHPCLTEKENTLTTTVTIAISPSQKPQITAKVFGIEPSFKMPQSLKLSTDYYPLPQTQVLGAKTVKRSAPTTQLVFWLQFTKISLWLNLLTAVVFLIGLSFFLPGYYRLLPG